MCSGSPKPSTHGNQVRPKRNQAKESQEISNWNCYELNQYVVFLLGTRCLEHLQGKGGGKEPLGLLSGVMCPGGSGIGSGFQRKPRKTLAELLLGCPGHSDRLTRVPASSAGLSSQVACLHMGTKGSLMLPLSWIPERELI